MSTSSGLSLRDKWDKWDKERQSWWSQLETGLESVFHRTITPCEYMELHSVVHNYCTRCPPSGQREKYTWRQPEMTPDLWMELYRKFKDFMTNFLLKDILEPLKGLQGEALLKMYGEKFDRFRVSSRIANGIFEWLNRMLQTGNENDRKQNTREYHNIFPVNTLCDVQWRQSLSRLILDMISEERSGKTTNSPFLRCIIDDFVECSALAETNEKRIRQSDGNESKPISLNIYKSAIEDAFLDETVKFYEQHSDSYLTSNSLNSYVKRVHIILAEEQLRCQKLMRESTGPLLTNALEDTLILRHLDIFLAQFAQLLAEGNAKEIALMYTILRRIPDHLSVLSALVESHLRAHDRLGSNVEQLATDPVAFVTTLLDVYYDCGMKLILAPTEEDHGFIVVLDQAFGAIVTRNAVTEHVKSSSVVAKLLARYCDFVLKKSSKHLNEVTLEETLNRVMIIFRHIEARDVFCTYYSNLLAKRLVQGFSASEDAEAALISKLKEICGCEYTSKLQRMFQDIGLSRDLNDQFNTHLETNHRSVTCEFAVQILSTGSWPLSSSRSRHMIVPAEIAHPLTVFDGFYQQKYAGRKLTWLYHMSRCELSATCFGSTKYILQVSAYQAVILLWFNNRDAATVNEFRSMLSFEQPFLCEVLVSLLKAKILLLQDEAEFEDERDLEDPDTTVRLNMGFKSKKLRINLNVPIRAEQKQEEESTNRVIEEDRKVLIQATIVRIMKMRKQLNHQQLIGEAIEMLSARFKPSVPSIKKCIEIMIGKEYIKREEENKDIYSYVA